MTSELRSNHTSPVAAPDACRNASRRWFMEVFGVRLICRKIPSVTTKLVGGWAVQVPAFGPHHHEASLFPAALPDKQETLPVSSRQCHADAELLRRREEAPESTAPCADQSARPMWLIECDARGWIHLTSHRVIPSSLQTQIRANARIARNRKRATGTGSSRESAPSDKNRQVTSNRTSPFGLSRS